MLTPSEQKTVQEALAVALAEGGDVRAYVKATFAPRDVNILRDLPTNLTKSDEQATFILSACLDSRWPPPPELSLLELLLTALVTTGDTALVPLRDRVRLGESADPNPDPVKTLWVRETMPFFSRDKLRPTVKVLLTADAQPILRIIGPSEKSGKTYTGELIDHASAVTRRDVHVVIAEVAKGAGPSYGPEDLADTLVTPTTRDVNTRPKRTASSYPAALCRWILNAAIQSPGRWIYVLDGFNQTNLQEETRQLVEALAQQIAGPGEFRKRMRLVLIDYEAKLPSVHLGTLLDDHVPAPATLTANDIAVCLAEHYDDLARRGRPKGSLDANALAQTAQALLVDASTNGSPSLQILNDMLTQLRLDDLRS
jgi:hypothetical protein